MRYALCAAALLLIAPPAFVQAEKQPATETVTILVARKDIPWGTLLKEPEKVFKEVRYVKGDEPKNAVTNFEQLKGKRTLRALAEDQPVKTKDLGDAAAEVALPKGMRAVAIKVGPQGAGAGFVLPGSRVDVIQTVHRGEDKAESKTILQNVLVLAIDSVGTATGEKGGATAASIFTLAMIPDDVKNVRLAEGAGELSLCLRAADEDDIIPLKKTAPERLPDHPQPVRRAGDK
jgi:pilus assembly protein CpaB